MLPIWKLVIRGGEEGHYAKRPLGNDGWLVTSFDSINIISKEIASNCFNLKTNDFPSPLPTRTNP
jgi:hypothetical protein